MKQEVQKTIEDTNGSTKVHGINRVHFHPQGNILVGYSQKSFFYQN
jgi:hypothetical protein